MRQLVKAQRSEVPALRGNRWPDFALAATDLYRQRGHKQPPPLGASRPAEFPPAVRKFLASNLLPKLTYLEKAWLGRLEGRWPDYPLALLKLARQKRLVIPGMSLPGQPELWDSAFVALHQLSPEDRESLDVIARDPHNGLNPIKEWSRQRKPPPRHKWPPHLGGMLRRGRR
jgi:hypothetical protein